MSTKKYWNPELYLKFNEERTQPAIDLATRINILSPKNIIDIGCGPGNSTQVLSRKWPDSKIIGIDNSTAMIESAEKNHPEMEWKVTDASKLKTETKYDIVFSNAAIQWIPNHEKLISSLVDLLTDNGALAIQVPQYFTMPASKAIESVSLKQKWKNQISGATDVFTFHSNDFYYNTLQAKVKSIVMWETSYFHIMPSHQAIVEMLKSTGIRPFLDMLDTEKEKFEFEKDVLNEITKAYPAQKDSNILFPFRRLFFIGYK